SGQPTAGVLTQEQPLASRDDEETSVRQPVDAKRETERDAENDLPVAFEIGGYDLLGAPVRKPKATVMPTRRFPVWPKISERVENMRFSMMDTGDNGQQMDAPVGIRDRPGESRTPSAERISRGGEPYSESAPP